MNGALGNDLDWPAATPLVTVHHD